MKKAARLQNSIYSFVQILILTLSFGFGPGASFASADEVSCECPKLGCDPCSIERGISFYTEKCGPRESKMKSCGRPTCIPIDEATRECPNPPKSGSGPREPVVLNTVEKVDPNSDISAAQVGKVRVISGSVSIVHADGKKITVNGEHIVRETDTVESATDGTAVVDFEGGNKVHVHPSSAVQVKEYKNVGDPSDRKALLNLIKGKIRNQVNQKYNGKTSSYQVTTKAAVAGVRGTDFVIEFNDAAGSDGGASNFETRVETIGGKVLLGGLNERETREIEKGEGATYTIAANALNDKAVADFVQKGTLSPKYKIPAERLRELDMESRVDVAKGKKPKAFVEKEICDKPKAKFNECLWKIVDDKCTRSRCNANGKWAEVTVVPAGVSAICPASGHLVKACDY